MIKIKPVIEQQSNCPYCSCSLNHNNVLWQGIHICITSKCPNCGKEIIEDLKTGQAFFTPYQINFEDEKLFGNQESRGWFGEPLYRSLKDPIPNTKLEINIEKFADYKNVIILNCIDYLYGHCLLKLLNAEKHLKTNKDFGLIIITQDFLRWMIPNGVAEIWSVNLPLSKAQNYYPYFHKRIENECERFETIYISYAHSHPKEFDISTFSGIEKHSFATKDYRITFVWREDRLWLNNKLFIRILGKFKLKYIKSLLLKRQNHKIIKLFRRLKKDFPMIKFTVVGLGTSTTFPKWIQDMRVKNFSEEKERYLCQIYSQSRLVIGVHGSNMLLPSGHAGMSIDLMPMERWGNFAQDILYQENDNRLASYKYRYLPINISVNSLNRIIVSQVKGYDCFYEQMVS